MSVSRILNVTRLLIAPGAFVRRAVEQDCQNANERHNYEAECEGRVAQKRKGVLKSFAGTLGVCVIAALTAKFLNLFFAFGEVWIMSLRILSIAVIAWAVLSRLGYDVETWNGETLLEKTSLSMFKLFYLSGLFLGIGSFFVEGN